MDCDWSGLKVSSIRPLNDDNNLELESLGSLYY